MTVPVQAASAGMSAGGVDLRPIRAVCIDLDGTLLDTIPDLAAAANRMLEDLGLERLDPALLETFVGKGVEVLVERTLAAAGRADDRPGTAGFDRARTAFYQRYRAGNGLEARLYDGVVDGLTQMQSLGLRLSCVTNKPGEFVGPLLDRFGLSSFFDFSIAGDTLPVKKPHPGPLLEACRRWSLTPAQVLAVGDSVNDAAAARAAGMPVVVVPYGYNEGRAADTIDADGIVPTLHELAVLLGKHR